MGFVCGTINQLSFNKNRKPDERQREETWGVGPYLGRKKGRETGGGGMGGLCMWLDGLITFYFKVETFPSSSVSFLLWKTAEQLSEVFFFFFYVGRLCLYASSF